MTFVHMHRGTGPWVHYLDGDPRFSDWRLINMAGDFLGSIGKLLVWMWTIINILKTGFVRKNNKSNFLCGHAFPQASIEVGAELWIVI